ncbi:LysR substrate-binding domain-containing protein [Streptomyces olivochromogenes]|uniref:LysR substrate-binding domain-containing protein n=1 Tax=Streptomyces olivochromogenes TaxID=1963 RepID=UPI001F30C646|nr:LysR substrate-binding domain-containing protein [Streptomyces olivochromogenes]
MGTWLVPKLVTGFGQSFPGVRFELHQSDENGLAQILLDATADLIITSKDPRHPLIAWRCLLVEPLWLAVPARHRLAQRRRVRPAEVSDEQFIVLKPGYGLRSITETLCPTSVSPGWPPAPCRRLRSGSWTTRCVRRRKQEGRLWELPEALFARPVSRLP